MNKILVRLYSSVPNTIKQFVGKTSWFKNLRDLILKKNGQYREVSTVIKKSYESYDVEFEFFGSVQNVAKASKKGIENTVLKNTFKLINANFKHENDCVVLDIGANFGYLSLVWATSICKHTGQVIAFEPNPNVYRSFLKSITKNNLMKTITLENKAVGFQNNTIDMYLNNTTSNIAKHENAIETVKMDMITLDSYVKQHNLKRCDLIKIDVDGIELDILKGCVHTMLHYKPIFIVETNKDRRIIEFFIKHHYTVLNMSLEEHVLGSDLPLNIFCIPNRLDR